MIEVFEAAVFVGDDGKNGDKHGIIVDVGKHILPEQRQAIALKLGYAETIFINDVAASDISFFAQTEEIPFAGTAALAVAAMLKKLSHHEPNVLKSMGNTINVSFNLDIVWVDADLSIMPAWNFLNLDTVSDVEEFNVSESKKLAHTMVWSWMDKRSGTVRARTFASDWLLPEVEANGSGSMLLASQLDRRLVIKHGRGTKIFAEPKPGNMAKLGGRVVIAEGATGLIP